MESETNSKITETVSIKDKEILELKSKIDVNDKEAKLKLYTL